MASRPFWKSWSSPAPFFFLSASRNFTPDGAHCAFSIYDPANNLNRTVKLPLKLGHAVVGNPRHRRRVFAVEQYGKHIAEVDVLDATLVRIIEAGAGRLFYGHGAFSPDAKYFYSPEISEDLKGAGSLVVRDGKTFAELEVIPTYGKFPHDVMLYGGEKTLVVATQGDREDDPNGEPSALVFLDLESKKLLRRVEQPHRGYQLSHLSQDESGHLAVGSFFSKKKNDEETKKTHLMISNPATRDDGMRRFQDTLEFLPVPLVFFRDSLVQHAPEPEISDMRITLGICLHPRNGVAAAAHVGGGLVTFSCSRTNRLLAQHRPDSAPIGVALTHDQAEFAVSTVDNEFYFYDASSLELRRKIRPEGFQFGHHMTAWQAG